MTTKYTFETTPTYEFHDHKTHRRHRRNTSASSSEQLNDNGDPIDCSGSLTYSATSSINSGCGESTDSSFADIMKVLDIQDSTNLTSYLKGSRRDEKSVAESLAYSTDADTYLRSLATDADSHLHGADVLSQANVNVAEKFQGEREDMAEAFTDNIFFAPAEHTESIKQRKERKRQERQQRRAARAQGTSPQTSDSPRTSIHVGSRGLSQSLQHQTTVVRNNSSSRYSNSLVPPDSPSYESRQGTPPSSSAPSPRPPKSRAHSTRDRGNSSLSDDDEDVWYAKWWMFCFPDTVRNMTERR